MRTSTLTTLDKAQDFVSCLDSEEEVNLLTALLLSLSESRAKRAADAAGYDLEQQ